MLNKIKENIHKIIGDKKLLVEIENNMGIQRQQLNEEDIANFAEIHLSNCLELEHDIEEI